jgi:hypothetical protein
MKKILLFSVFTLLISTINAQEIALVKSSDLNFYESRRSSETIEPILEKTKYTYKYNNDLVNVEFNDNEHVEYFDNKKYYIKSKLEWIASDECIMTLKESNLPDFPFREGTKLHMKISKIKKGKVHYESTLGGRTWSGKMKIKE